MPPDESDFPGNNMATAVADVNAHARFATEAPWQLSLRTLPEVEPQFE
jgi:hypothetical protein